MEFNRRQHRGRHLFEILTPKDNLHTNKHWEINRRTRDHTRTTIKPNTFQHLLSIYVIEWEKYVQEQNKNKIHNKT